MELVNLKGENPRLVFNIDLLSEKRKGPAYFYIIFRFKGGRQ